jgi:hypothetical protein
MNRLQILDPQKSYTFRHYFKMRFSIVDILAALGATYTKASLNFASQTSISSEKISALDQRIRAVSSRVNLSSEAARREALVFPILFELAETAQAQIEIEYSVEVNQYLKGEFDYYLFDYYLRAQHQMLVVEAKQADLTHGFTQLAAELIALDTWTDADIPILYGAVTTGDIWQFGTYDRPKKLITQDLELYRVPADLTPLMTALLGAIAPM